MSGVSAVGEHASPRLSLCIESITLALQCGPVQFSAVQCDDNTPCLDVKMIGTSYL